MLGVEHEDPIRKLLVNYIVSSLADSMKRIHKDFGTIVPTDYRVNKSICYKTVNYYIGQVNKMLALSATPTRMM
jgi:hypothetical protein